MWHRIRLEGSDSAIEQMEMQNTLSNVLLQRNVAVAAQVRSLRESGLPVRLEDRDAEIRSHREQDVIVWHLNDAALELYRLAGGTRLVEAVVEGMPEPGRQSRVLMMAPIFRVSQ